MRGEGADSDAAHVLVTGGAEAATAVDGESNVLGVTYGSDAESWLSRLAEGADRRVVVSVGEQSRSAAATASGVEPVTATAGVVETVEDETDVGAVGVLVHEYLSAWEGEPATVYVDGVERLLDAVPAEDAFRFLHAVLARADAAGATVVASLDAAAYPGHVVETFAELFDDVRA
ncbi:MAG: hypothetical protein ABEJ90_04570 [Halobacterium sp.]